MSSPTNSKDFEIADNPGPCLVNEVMTTLGENKFACDDLLAKRVADWRTSNSHYDAMLITQLLGARAKNNWNSKRITVNSPVIKISERTKPTILLKKDNKNLKCLVDSGSDRCVVKYETLEAIKDDAEITPVKNVHLKGIGGRVRVIGETRLSIKLPNSLHVMQVEALVIRGSDYDGNIILGRDLFYDQGAILDFGKRTLTIGGYEIPFVKNCDENKKLDRTCLMSIVEKKKKKRISMNLKNRDQNVYSLEEVNNCNIAERKEKRKRRKKKKKLIAHKSSIVHICSDTRVEAQCMATLCAFAKVEPGEYIVTRGTVTGTNLIIAASLSKVGPDRKVPIAVVNLTSEEVKIPAGTMIAEITRVTEDLESEILVNDIESDVRKSISSQLGAQVGKSVGDKAGQIAMYRGNSNGATSFISETSKSEAAHDSDIFINSIRDKLDVGDMLQNENLRYFHKLINKYRKCISIKDTEIGRKGILKHEIKLKNVDTVVNNPPYRIPHK